MDQSLRNSNSHKGRDESEFSGACFNGFSSFPILLSVSSLREPLVAEGASNSLHCPSMLSKYLWVNDSMILISVQVHLETSRCSGNLN